MIAELTETATKGCESHPEKSSAVSRELPTKGKIQIGGVIDKIKDAVNWERCYRTGSGQCDQVVGSNHKAVKRISVGLGQLAS